MLTNEVPGEAGNESSRKGRRRKEEEVEAEADRLHYVWS